MYVEIIMGNNQKANKVNGVEHWHFILMGSGQKSLVHSHKGGHKRHEHEGTLEYGRTRKSLLANQWRDF